MTFNHWEPNLSWNALNLFTSVGSSRKLKTAISPSKNGFVQFFWISFSGANSFFQIKPSFKRFIIGYHILPTNWTTIFDSFQLKKEDFCHPKQQALSLPLYFLHRAYYLLAFFSARGHSEASLKFGAGDLKITHHLLEFFLFFKELMLVVCLRPFSSIASKKTRTTLKIVTHFVTSFTL